MYEDRTPETIRAEMLADIQASTGFSAVTGGYIDTMVGRMAVEHAKIYSALNAIPAILFPDADSGGLLDLNGETYHNLARRPGAKARTSMNFSGTPGLILSVGTAFVGAGGLEFDLVESVTLDKNGTGGGIAEAVAVGTVYNVGKDALTTMYVNISGLDEWHNAAAHGGTDEESDAAYFARIDEKRKRPPTSGNVYDYRQWALEISGVGAVKVIPLQNGPGTVGMLVVGNDMAPADEQIITAVADNVEGKRPIGPEVAVSAPEAVPVAISATVELAPGGGAAAVQTAFAAKVRDYLHEVVAQKYGAIYFSKDGDLPYKVVYNRVAALLMGVEGVANFTVLTINGAAGDLEFTPGQVPVLGAVVVT